MVTRFVSTLERVLAVVVKKSLMVTVQQLAVHQRVVLSLAANLVEEGAAVGSARGLGLVQVKAVAAAVLVARELELLAHLVKFIKVEMLSLLFKTLFSI